jgi:hypothetical protein
VFALTDSTKGCGGNMVEKVTKERDLVEELEFEASLYHSMCPTFQLVKRAAAEIRMWRGVKGHVYLYVSDQPSVPEKVATPRVRRVRSG